MTDPTWKFFVLARDKRPLANCSRCQIPHDPDSCQCLTCHGFYAATDDDTKIHMMNRLYPNHPWAVRTGKASGIIIIDVDGMEGIESLNTFEQLVGFPLDEAKTVAKTPSDGVHLYYRYPNVERISSRSRVLPGIDIKADDAYVVIPVNDERRAWVKSDGLGELGGRLLQWVETARGHSAGGQALSYSFNDFVRDGCPDGYRDDFFNKLAFGYRKANTPFEVAKELVYNHWLKCAQPLEFQTSKSCGEARWYMPWKDALYKLTRAYKTVTPDRNGVADRKTQDHQLARHLRHLGVSTDLLRLHLGTDGADTERTTHPPKRTIIFKSGEE